MGSVTSYPKAPKKYNPNLQGNINHKYNSKKNNTNAYSQNIKRKFLRFLWNTQTREDFNHHQSIIIEGLRKWEMVSIIDKGEMT